MKTLKLALKLMLKLFTILILSFGLSSCGDPLKALYKEISRYGYILYKTPLEFAGPGTLVGGPPTKMYLISEPQTCFPKFLQDGTPTNIYKYDNTTIATRSYTIKMSGKLSLDLLGKFLKLGGISLNLGAGMEAYNVTQIELKLDGVHIEYLDSINLVDHYVKNMSQTCKDFLNQVGFIIQAIKVEKMYFRFVTKSGVLLKLDLGIVEQLLNFSPSIEFSVEQGSVLRVDTPRYLGYQLGRLRYSDKGLALFRASETRKIPDSYIFNPINIFDYYCYQWFGHTVCVPKDQLNKSNIMSSNGSIVAENGEKLIELNSKDDIKELLIDEKDTIDHNAIYNSVYKSRKKHKE
ncbi:MAG: hypothetical protein HQK49_17760 [Oligoflexia bacterium]|nr:hypothetical protein [Oligoflexia bacterium]